MTAVSHLTKNFHCSFCNQMVYGEKKLFEMEDDDVVVETFCEKCGHILDEHKIRKFHRLAPMNPRNLCLEKEGGI